MSSVCYSKLIVLGLKGRSDAFARNLEQAICGNDGPKGKKYYGAVEVVAGPYAEFRFQTKRQPPVSELMALSKKGEPMVAFLLEYRCWESGFRGQTVIRAGREIECIHRNGYDGPDFLWAHITDPLVDLFTPYLESRTLAQQASDRLRDAIEIVRGVKRTLEDPRFTGSRYRILGNIGQVKETRAQLEDMLGKMIESEAQINFDGVLVEEPKAIAEPTGVR